MGTEQVSLAQACDMSERSRSSMIILPGVRVKKPLVEVQSGHSPGETEDS